MALPLLTLSNPTCVLVHQQVSLWVEGQGALIGEKAREEGEATARRESLTREAREP
jgi:hypothetical protein